MKSLRLLALAVVLAAQAAPAQAACPPAKLVLSTIREANSVQLLRLGSRSERDVDWQSDDPDVFLGYEVLDSNPLLPAEAAALARVLASPASYDCKAARSALTTTPGAADVGFTFHSDVAVVRVVFHVNERQVELEFFNGAHTGSVVSSDAHNRLERLLDSYAIRTTGSRKAWNERMGGTPAAMPLSTRRESFSAGFNVDEMGYPVNPIATIEVVAEGSSGADLAGTVQLNVLVNASGDVDSIFVTKSIPTLDEKAVAAVRGWKFHPSKYEGRPVPSWIPIPVQFRIR